MPVAPAALRHFLPRHSIALTLAIHLSMLPTSASDGSAHSAPCRITIGQVNPWSHLEFHDDPRNFQFVVVTDRTGGARAGVFPQGLTKADLLEPEFVMSVGDLIEGYSQEPEVLHSEWDEFESFVDSRLDMPFFYVPGNHDIAGEVSAQVWKERFGPAYYHFIYRDVLFLCLNSEDGQRARIGGAQIAYADSVLAANLHVRWTLVFVHQPLWVYTDDDGAMRDTGWAQVEALLRDRRHSVFAGHFHRYQKYERNNRDYFILATTGGGSSLRGPLYGEFDHVVWVTMTDEGPKVANLMLEGILDADVRTEQTVALTAPLAHGNAVSIPPVFITADEDGEPFATTLRLFNDADVPLGLSGSFTRHPALRVTPPAFDVELEPNAVELIDLRVTSSGASLGEHESVALEWEAEYRQDEVRLPELGGKYELTLLKLLEKSTIRYDPGGVRVDGKLTEWTELPLTVDGSGHFRYGAERWTGPGDASCRFGARHDDGFLYIGVDVTDDDLVYRADKQYPWEQDGVEVRVDARPDPRRSLSRDGGDQEMTTYITVWMAPGRRADEVFLMAGDSIARLGVEVSGLFTDTGYTCEVAVPLSYVIERQGEDWDKIRVNVTIDDRDGDEGLCQLWWHPHWSLGDSFPGSGTLVRK